MAAPGSHCCRSSQAVSRSGPPRCLNDEPRPMTTSTRAASNEGSMRATRRRPSGRSPLERPSQSVQVRAVDSQPAVGSQPAVDSQPAVRSLRAGVRGPSALWSPATPARDRSPPAQARETLPRGPVQGTSCGPQPRERPRQGAWMELRWSPEPRPPPARPRATAALRPRTFRGLAASPRCSGPIALRRPGAPPRPADASVGFPPPEAPRQAYRSATQMWGERLLP